MARRVRPRRRELQCRGADGGRVRARVLLPPGSGLRRNGKAMAAPRPRLPPPRAGVRLIETVSGRWLRSCAASGRARGEAAPRRRPAASRSLPGVASRTREVCRAFFAGGQQNHDGTAYDVRQQAGESWPFTSRPEVLPLSALTRSVGLPVGSPIGSADALTFSPRGREPRRQSRSASRSAGGGRCGLRLLRRT